MTILSETPRDLRRVAVLPKEPVYVDRRFESVHEFCRALGELAWRSRPAVFRNPLGFAMGGPAELRKAVVDAGRAGLVPRIYADCAAVEVDPREDVCRDHESLREFCARLSQRHGSPELGYVLNEFATSNQDCWLRAVGFLRDLHKVLGLPAGYSSLTLFMGSYRKTPFGFHKDKDDVLTFVVEGTKRFLTWPYLTLQGDARVPSDAHYRECVLPGFDYGPLRAQATVLEGRPGDILYWPWDHWHVAESDDGFTATLSLGNSPLGLCLKELTRAASRVGYLGARNEPFEAGGDAGRALDEQISELMAALRDDRIAAALHEELLLRRSRLGLMSHLPPLPPRPLDDAATVAAPLQDVIFWYVDQGTLTAAVGGHGFKTAARQPVVEMLAELNRALPVKVSELRRRYCGERGLSSLQFQDVLGRLLRFRGVITVPPSASTRA